MKSDLTSCKYYYPKSDPKVNNFMAPVPHVNRSYGMANDSLMGLRNHLSEMIN